MALSFTMYNERGGRTVFTGRAGTDGATAAADAQQAVDGMQPTQPQAHQLAQLLAAAQSPVPAVRKPAETALAAMGTPVAAGLSSRLHCTALCHQRDALAAFFGAYDGVCCGQLNVHAALPAA